MKRVRKEDMIAGPYNPNRELSFADKIVSELNKRLEDGSLSPVIYSYAVDLTRMMSKQLNNIYGEARHGLRQALATVLRLTYNRLPR